MIAGLDRQRLADLIGAKHLPAEMTPFVHDRVRLLVKRLLFMISNIDKDPEHADRHAEDAEALAWALRVLTLESVQDTAMKELFGRSNEVKLFTSRSGDGGDSHVVRRDALTGDSSPLAPVRVITQGETR